MAKITCLDASTLDRGDIDFSSLRALGSLTLHSQTTPGDVLERCREAEVLITNKVVLDESVIPSCPNLRYIVISATGTNNVDLRAAAAAGVPVSNVSGYSTPSVAQHVLGLILTLASQFHRYLPEAGLWPHSPIFTRLDHPIMELAGKTLGIAGLGAIGSRVATLAQSFGMHSVALARESPTPGGSIPRLPREQFFASCEFISLHCPLTADTQHLINDSSLSLMKPGAFLINTGRGPLIDEAALLRALESGHLGGAALDVLSVEPPALDHPLILAAARLPHLLITPHTAWASREARTRLLATVVDHIRHFLASGEAPSRVA